MSENRSSRLRDQIEDAIAGGLYRPGERLDEISLATKFGVSRTPIREALQQLSAVGLVELRTHRGAIVSAADPRRMVEMFELMAELEAMCAKLAARRFTSEDKARLETTLHACKIAAETGDSDAYYYENELFHQAIYTASGNQFLEEQAIALHRRLAIYRRLQLRVRNRMSNSQQEHQDIVDAILSGNAPLAGEKIREHIAIQGERFSDLLASLNAQQACAK